MPTTSSVAMTVKAATTRSLSLIIDGPLFSLRLSVLPVSAVLATPSKTQRRKVRRDAEALLEFHIRKLQKLFPIKRRDRVPTCMNVECKRFHNRLIQRRHLSGPEIFTAEQLV